MTQKIKEALRDFKLTSLAVDNGTSVFLISLMILLFGIQGYQQMPKEQYPEAFLPTVFINTPYFGNSAEEVETFITRPLEKEINSIVGIKDVKSTSIQDFSSIIAEFNTDMENDVVLRKIKDAVDKAKQELPDDLDNDPEILEVNLSDIPIVTINISGDYPSEKLKYYAEIIQDRVEELKEISDVDLKGALDREVKINADLIKMQSVKVSFYDIEQAVASENVTLSGGEISNDGFKRSLRVIGQFDDIKQIEDLIVKSEKQNPIFLKDIAKVDMGFKDRTSIARSDGLPVISLDVIKRKGENLLDAADNIEEVLNSTRHLIPDDIRISSFNDQSINTRITVSSLENSIIFGVILVVLVLLFFLGLRNASFVGLAIPLSMLLGIMILNIMGITMNIVVLFALILALGLLVDNGIVVVENIYRYMQNGSDGREAAKYGAGEVAMPIIASTATTLAAFLPLAFWPGIVGEFMKYMPYTLIVVLISSLFVALIINPVFTSRFMKLDEKRETKELRNRKTRNVLIGAGFMLLVGIVSHLIGVEWMRNLMGISIFLSLLNHFILRPLSFGFQNRFLPVLERNYNRFIKLVLRRFNPILTILGTIMMLFIAITMLYFNQPKVDFFPNADPLYVNCFVELPAGTDIERTDEIVKKVEADINEVLKNKKEVVEAVLTQIGENTSDPNSPPEPGLTPNKARITISFVPYADRGNVSTRDIMMDIRNSIKGYPGVKISVDKNADGPATGKPINLEIRGDDIDSLLVHSDRVLKILNQENVPGVEELQIDVKLGKPELLLNIDRAASRRYELSTMNIAGTLRTSLFGKEVSKFKDGEDDYPIMVRADESQRNDIRKLINQPITFRSQATGQIVQVPISSVVDYDYSSTYNYIKRKNSKRVVTISSNVLTNYNANEIIAELEGIMDFVYLPEGYTWEFTGEQQQQSEDMAFLNNAFLAALFLIFIIIVAQFNSIISPFIIIISVLFSTIGVFLGYALSGQNISVVFTGVGIISLAGVVVNNAIVLIDYINLLIKQKRESLGLASMSLMEKEDVRDAIVRGGATRLRPVLLTAITTVLGLIPLAVGINLDFINFIKELDFNYYIGGDNTAMWGPMAWTVIYGLIFATFLTLVVVPVMYWMAYRMKSRISKLFSKK